MADVSAETEKTRAEVADYLREFADELSPPGERAVENDQQGSSRTPDGGKVTVIVGNESATINPPATLSFGVEVDANDSLLGSPTGERGVTFSLNWSSEDVETDDKLDIG